MREAGVLAIGHDEAREPRLALHPVVPVQRELLDRRAYVIRLGPKLAQHSDGNAALIAKQAEQDVLRSGV